MREQLGSVGIDASKAVERARGRSASAPASRASRGLKRGRSEARSEAGDEDMEGEGSRPKKRIHSNRSRSLRPGAGTEEPAPGSGLKDKAQKNKAQKLADKAQRRRNMHGKAGEADRVIQTKMPKHLFSGKRSNGKTDRR